MDIVERLKLFDCVDSRDAVAEIERIRNEVKQLRSMLELLNPYRTNAAIEITIPREESLHGE